MKTAILATLLLALSMPALAEKADANQLIDIKSKAFHGDALAEGVEYLKDVVVRRGTLLIRADRALVKEDEQGYTYLTLYADPGKLVSFRQKRDGGDFWMEGEAERIEYDDKGELVKFYSKVTLRQLEGTRPQQELKGQYFTFNNRTEKFSMLNDASGTTAPSGPDVHHVIQPRVIKPAPNAGKQ